MSENENPFEKYVENRDFFKQPKTYVVLVTLLVAVFLGYLLFRFLVLEKMNAKEVAASIKIVQIDSKWVEKEATEQGVKIVPSVSFKFMNTGKRALRYVNFEGIFEVSDTGTVHSDGVAQACKKPLLPGQVSEEVFIQAFFGYSASSKQAFLQNIEEWKKMHVKIFANTRGSGPVRIGDKYPIKQEIEGLEQEAVEAAESLREDAQKIKTMVEVVENDSKWLDRKVSTGKVVIVPSITIQVKNISNEPIDYLYLKGVFEFIDTGELLCEVMAENGAISLAAGEVSEDISIKGDLGYEASSIAAFFQNRRNWRPVRAKILARIKESIFILLADYPVKQEIEGVKAVYHLPDEKEE